MLTLDEVIDTAGGDGGAGVRSALLLIAEMQSIDGAHHKQWLIDQVTRILTGCPLVTEVATSLSGATYSYQRFGESRLYRDLVAAACDGEDGPGTYEWDEGITP